MFLIPRRNHRFCFRSIPQGILVEQETHGLKLTRIMAGSMIERQGENAISCLGHLCGGFCLLTVALMIILRNFVFAGVCFI